MTATHTVLFTVVPRGITINRQTLPVSILVSPRLQGADRLGAFPDWVDWMTRLQRGVRIVVTSKGRTATVDIDTTPLRPDLWRALFNEETFVASRTFDDYSAHGVMSFSVRETLSALKALYQEAGLVLGMPDPVDERDPNDPERTRGQHGRVPPPTNRQRLGAMLSGLEVHWNRTNAKRWREVTRARAREGSAGQRALNGPLDREGLITAARNPAAFQAIAGQFAAYHHMPTPTEEQGGAVAFDPDKVDFHQALSALEAYPALQRALGLVFDLELPRDLLPATPAGTPVTLAVTATTIPWQVAPTTRPLDTACVHLGTGNATLFAAASRTQSTAGGPLQVFGLLNLDPDRFGLAQVDVDGAMHKAITAAEIYNSPDPGRSHKPVDPEPAPHPEVHDPLATLPSMRSGGLQLYLDGRGETTVDAITQSKAFNDALELGGVQPRPFYAEDLVRGYRLDLWHSKTGRWQSLHRRSAAYRIGDDEVPFDTDEEEGFFQLAAVQPARGAEPADKDLYVHEIIARWTGWSLSVPFPGKALSRHGDPAKAIPPDGDDPDYRTDEPITAFKVRATYKVTPGSLPKLRFGTRYRVRARAVDLAGNSLGHEAPLADTLTRLMGLPRDADGQAYLRYDPVAAPLVVVRDEAAVTGPGSALHRLVLRTFNATPEQDGEAADIKASDRHIVPPRTSVEMAERLGMLDAPDGSLKADPATYALAADRDAGQLPLTTITIAGKEARDVPLVPGDAIDTLPYLPDLLSRGAAIRDLPGAPSISVGRASSADPGAGAVQYTALADINPRPGSATLVSFDTNGDWQGLAGFRLALGEPPAGQASAPPMWDPVARVLAVSLPKGQTAIVPLSSYMTPADLTLMGQWQWLREFVDVVTILGAQPAHLLPGQPVDLVAHVLQRAVEGGHWILTPPTLLTLVHAVQQPLGRPSFAALNIGHTDLGPSPYGLQLDRVRGRTDPQELAPITAWRRLNETSSYLMGALRIHGASTAKVDLRAEWVDPVDRLDEPEPGVTHVEAAVDELPVLRPLEGYLVVPGADVRRVGYYDPENDQIAFVRSGDHAGPATASEQYFVQAAPRHELGDTKRRIVRYSAIATSRYREYFPQHAGLSFTRTSETTTVDVPASARPLAPGLVYVVPTFGWQRQSDTNLKRSVRYGGGLRVYLERGWYSSGEGELLGVALWSGSTGALDDVTRDKYKAYFTQWGMDPIWKAAGLSGAPGVRNFPDAVASDTFVSLDEVDVRTSTGAPGRVDVVGFAPQYDPERRLWFADLTIDLAGSPAEFIAQATYTPFVRLALVRYQPHALDDARISRVVLAGFSQLTPDRTAMVTADPYHPRTLRVVVSGVAPSAPPPEGPARDRPARPTAVNVRVQRRTPGGGELGWRDAPPREATVTRFYEGQGLFQPYLGLWIGQVTFATPPAADTYRLLIEEFEYVSATYAEDGLAPGRLIYAETFDIDAALGGAPPG